jgi:hypothetical protein
MAITPDNARQPESPYTIFSAEEINNAATEYSEPFYLGRSRFFGVEWKLSGVPVTGFTFVLQMQTMDGTWINCTEGSAIGVTGTSQRGLRTVAPGYSKRKFRVAATNNEAGAISITMDLHRSVG